MVLSVSGDELIKEKVIRVLGRRDPDEEVETGLAMPGLVHERAKVVSITKWRQSFVGRMPRRTPSNRERRLTGAHHARNDSIDSGLIHPGVAYHDFRRQERAWGKAADERKAIKVTYETKISSQSAPDKSVDMGQVSSGADVRACCRIIH